jgi:hypothetical protein
MAAPLPRSSTLVRLLQAAGYRLETRAGVTVGVRTRDHRSVVIASTARSPAEVERQFPVDSVRRTIVYDDDPGPTCRAYAADRGIEVLDPSTLGPALGEMLLPSPSEADSAGADPDPGFFDLPFPTIRPGDRTVRPRIGRAEAEALCGIDHPRYTLRLVPYYVAAYHVRPATADGGHGAVLHRVVAVNAANRRAEVWDEGERELVADVAEPHQRLAPQFAEAVATPLAIEAIRRQHTVRVDHTEQHGGTLVIESRRVAPSADDVRLGPFVLLYVPHWYAEGTEGRVVIDAVTGRREG